MILAAKYKVPFQEIRQVMFRQVTGPRLISEQTKVIQFIIQYVY